MLDTRKETEDRMMKNFKNNKGFTLVEMITAIAVLVIIIGFSSIIFRTSIDSYRTANANMEIMQKLRAITGQLNTDFEGFCKDGYLIIKTGRVTRYEYKGDTDFNTVNMDRIYYFTTGDFQSWSNANVRSNIARVFMGHDDISISDANTLPFRIPLSQCKLARDVCLLTPDSASEIDDSNNISFAQCKAYPLALEGDPNAANGILNASVPTEISINQNNVRHLMCENAGEFKIDWTIGEINSITKRLIWYSQSRTWLTTDTKPEAIKFTFTLYDLKGVLKGGRRFSHIVYLGN
jgi:prepilin-type N-terminal cleavage/methylation domain-containing protein